MDQVYLQYLQAKEIKLSLSKNNHIGKIISDILKFFLDKKTILKIFQWY